MKIAASTGLAHIQVPRVHEISFDEGFVTFIVDGLLETAAFARDGLAVWVEMSGHTAKFTLPDPGAEEMTGKSSVAPMTGRVVKLPVKIGDDVKSGDLLAILEAMKMEYRLEAEADGVVEEVGAKVGDLVDLGQTLVRLK